MFDCDPEKWRILTVRQPWADFLVADAAWIEQIRQKHPRLEACDLPKTVENRPFATPFRGPVLIRAGLEIDLEATSLWRLDPMSFVLGHVIGVVQLDSIVTDSVSGWALPGAKHWQVSNPRRFAEPFRVAQGNWQGLQKPRAAAVVAAISRLNQTQPV